MKKTRAQAGPHPRFDGVVIHADLIRNPRGYWAAHYYEPAGETRRRRRVSLGTTDLEEARNEAHRLDLELAVRLGRLSPAALDDRRRTLTIEAGLRVAIELSEGGEGAGGVAPKTLVKYRQQDDDFLAYARDKGVHTWAQVTERTVRDYGRWLKDTRGNSPGTVHDKLERLLSVIMRLVRTGDLPEAAKVTLRLSKPQPGETYCYSREQVTALLQTAESLGLTHIARVLAFLAGTGVRVNEALALRWDDIDLDEATAAIRHVSGGGRRTKSGRTRVIHLGDELTGLVRTWPRGNDLVFTGPSGARLRDRVVLQTLQEQLIPAVLAADSADPRGLDRGTVHGLRHYFVSQCVCHGMPLPYIQGQIGHADSEIIRRYIHLSRDESRRRLSEINFLGTAGTGA